MLKLVYQKKHVASPDTHQVNSGCSSDKDYSAQGIGLSKLGRKKRSRKTRHDRKVGKLESYTVDSIPENMTW